MMGVDLKCTACSKKEQGKKISEPCEYFGTLRRWDIGWRVPAYPTNDLETLGVDNEEAVAWWLSLPCNVMTDEKDREDMILDRLAAQGGHLKRSLAREAETGYKLRAVHEALGTAKH